MDVDSATATFSVRLSVTRDVVDGAILASITKTGGLELRSDTSREAQILYTRSAKQKWHSGRPPA